MHSLNHPASARSVVAERIEAAGRAARYGRSTHPPPVRSRTAYAVARIARRIDIAAARRAVA
jgi:hypothetical protein